MASGSADTHACPVLSSFSANLRQHLTELTLNLGYARHPKEDHLGLIGNLSVLSMLTALQKLEVGDMDVCTLFRPLGHNLFKQRLALELPNLVSLHISALSHGVLLLSCPKLAKLKCVAMESVRLEVKEAALDNLVIQRCHDVQVRCSSPEDQLQNLVSLHVSQSRETERPLIEDLSHMRRLQTLVYTAFPVESMPTSFPLGLESLSLCPNEWFGEIPEGVEKLHSLKFFHLNPIMGYRFENYPYWNTPELELELLSLESLEELRLGELQFERSDDGSSWRNY